MATENTALSDHRIYLMQPDFGRRKGVYNQVERGAFISPVGAAEEDYRRWGAVPGQCYRVFGFKSISIAKQNCVGPVSRQQGSTQLGQRRAAVHDISGAAKHHQAMTIIRSKMDDSGGHVRSIRGFEKKGKHVRTEKHTCFGTSGTAFLTRPAAFFDYKTTKNF
jgi:hypothetical protein